jgi:hypothetical protein
MTRGAAVEPRIGTSGTKAANDTTDWEEKSRAMKEKHTSPADNVKP